MKIYIIQSNCINVQFVYSNYLPYTTNKNYFVNIKKKLTFNISNILFILMKILNLV